MKYEENETFDASKPTSGLKIFLENIPLVQNKHGVIRPNRTGIHAGHFLYFSITTVF